MFTNHWPKTEDKLQAEHGYRLLLPAEFHQTMKLEPEIILKKSTHHPAYYRYLSGLSLNQYEVLGPWQCAETIKLLNTFWLGEISQSLYIQLYTDEWARHYTSPNFWGWFVREAHHFAQDQERTNNLNKPCRAETLAKQWKNNIHLVLIPSQELLESFEIPNAVAKTQNFIAQIKNKVNYLSHKENSVRLIRFVLKELRWLCNNVESKSLKTLHARASERVGFIRNVNDIYEQYLATEHARRTLVTHLPALLPKERGWSFEKIPRWRIALRDGLVQTPKFLESLNWDRFVCTKTNQTYNTVYLRRVNEKSGFDKFRQGAADYKDLCRAYAEDFRSPNKKKRLPIVEGAALDKYLKVLGKVRKYNQLMGRYFRIEILEHVVRTLRLRPDFPALTKFSLTNKPCGFIETEEKGVYVPSGDLDCGFGTELRGDLFIKTVVVSVADEEGHRWPTKKPTPNLPPLLNSMDDLPTGLVSKLKERNLHTGCKQARDWGLHLQSNLLRSGTDGWYKADLVHTVYQGATDPHTFLVLPQKLCEVEVQPSPVTLPPLHWSMCDEDGNISIPEHWSTKIQKKDSLGIGVREFKALRLYTITNLRHPLIRYTPAAITIEYMYRRVMRQRRLRNGKYGAKAQRVAGAIYSATREFTKLVGRLNAKLNRGPGRNPKKATRKPSKRVIRLYTNFWNAINLKINWYKNNVIWRLKSKQRRRLKATLYLRGCGLPTLIYRSPVRALKKRVLRQVLWDLYQLNKNQPGRVDKHLKAARNRNNRSWLRKIPSYLKLGLWSMHKRIFVEALLYRAAHQLRIYKKLRKNIHVCLVGANKVLGLVLALNTIEAGFTDYCVGIYLTKIRALSQHLDNICKLGEAEFHQAKLIYHTKPTLEGTYWEGGTNYRDSVDETLQEWASIKADQSSNLDIVQKILKQFIREGEEAVRAGSPAPQTLGKGMDHALTLAKTIVMQANLGANLSTHTWKLLRIPQTPIRFDKSLLELRKLLDVKKATEVGPRPIFYHYYDYDKIRELWQSSAQVQTFYLPRPSLKELATWKASAHEERLAQLSARPTFEDFTSYRWVKTIPKTLFNNPSLKPSELKPRDFVDTVDIFNLHSDFYRVNRVYSYGNGDNTNQVALLDGVDYIRYQNEKYLPTYMNYFYQTYNKWIQRREGTKPLSYVNWLFFQPKPTLQEELLTTLSTAPTKYFYSQTKNIALEEITRLAQINLIRNKYALALTQLEPKLIQEICAGMTLQEDLLAIDPAKGEEPFSSLQRTLKAVQSLQLDIRRYIKPAKISPDLLRAMVRELLVQNQYPLTNYFGTWLFCNSAKGLLTAAKAVLDEYIWKRSAAKKKVELGETVKKMTEYNNRVGYCGVDASFGIGKTQPNTVLVHKLTYTAKVGEGFFFTLTNTIYDGNPTKHGVWSAGLEDGVLKAARRSSKNALSWWNYIFSDYLHELLCVTLGTKPNALFVYFYHFNNLTLRYFFMHHLYMKGVEPTPTLYFIKYNFLTKNCTFKKQRHIKKYKRKSMVHRDRFSRREFWVIN